MNFLSRLAQENDAIATVKNGNLLFMPTGTSTTATGKPLPPVEIVKSIGDSFNFSLTEGDNFTAVRAYWHNLDTGKKGEIVVDENTKIEQKAKTTKTGKVSKRKQNVIVQSEPIETNANKIKSLRHTYKTEASALNGAVATFKKMQRGVATFTMTLAFGNPELMPELPATIKGIKKEIDSTDWIISKVTHNLSDNGYTSAVEFEKNII
nr:contractile injection system protein, VgrG/Pvc8 family [Bisgaardia hudsonensis]